MKFSAVAGIVITVLLTLCGLLKQKSRFLFYVQGLWMWLIMGWNTYSVDWNSTYPIFVLADEKVSLKQDLYQNLCTIFKNWGFDFVHFNALMTFFALLLILSRIQSVASRPSLVLSLTFFYPFLDFVIQKRFFLAFSLIFWALPMAHSEAKKDKIKYLIIVLIAAWIHSSLFFYVVLLIINMIPKKILYRSIAILALFSSLGPNTVYRIMQLIPFVSANKFKLYFITYAQYSTIIKYLFWIGLHLMYFIAIYFIDLHLRKEKHEEKESVNAMYNNIFSLFLLPFYSFDPVFFRIFRPIIMSNYIYVSDHIKIENKWNNKLLYVNVFQIFLSITTFIIMYVLTSKFNAMFIRTFENNAFLDWLF